MAVPKLSLPSALGHDFSKVQSPSNPRSSFDRSFTRKTSFGPGQLIPVYVDECLPGDTISMNAKMVARVATLLYPIMDNLHLDVFWFFGPNRILWDNWKRFNGERTDPTQSIDLLIPSLAGDPLTISAGSMGDYFGLPPATYGDDLNALPFRLYNRIYNDWFRDENLQNSRPVNTDDGPDNISDYNIMLRGKRHDYFSSCLPWPQKGDAVPLPLGGFAPVVGTGQGIGLTADGPGSFRMWYEDTLSSGQLTARSGAPAALPITALGGSLRTDDAMVGVSTDPDKSGLVADLQSATAATVNDLRQAIAIQQLLELDGRGGTRYIEQMQHMWGVRVPDYRMQRPEYLGGSSKRMDIHAVPQTAPGTTPQAQLSAFGQMETDSGFTYSVLEHGYVMCIVNVRADITYQQGVHKLWNRRSRYHFYQPPLAHLGEQAVLMRELYYTGVDNADNVVFGYQERWAEYRYAQNLVTGGMRSSDPLTLDQWHLALKFTSAPDLENGFIEDQPPLSRVTAVADDELPRYQILMDMYASSRWARIMPVYSTPGLERL